MEKTDLSSIEFSPELLSTVPAATARMYETVPVRLTQQGAIVLAMPAKTVLQAVNDDLGTLRIELRCVLGRDVEFTLADRDQIHTFVDRLYGHET